MKNIYLPIEGLANGELQKEIEKEIKKLFDNIHNEKTQPTEERAITIRLKFKPDKERENVEVESEISTKLAKINGAKARVITRRNPNTGQIEAREVKSGIPGQSYLDDNGRLRSDVGELVD
ncbi:replication terminator protein [Pseudogracilibacillus sp. SE30717A]|uniref:replication terminator protein n=1 Tax=Pseudogracilibacillus sp. SE30717A TaxID=3098293 RepID=UPI00300E5A67